MTKPRSYQDLLKISEPLRPELKKWLEESEAFGQVLKHPLVFGIPYIEQMNAVYNEQLKYKKQHVAKATIEKNWYSYIFLHERPYRFNALHGIKDQVENDKEYWELVSSVWTDTENLWQVQDLLSDLITANRTSRQCMMDEEEERFLKEMPDDFLIYRGHQENNQKGYSWTLSFWKAKWFANRFGQGEVSEALCNKESAIALLMGRGETEIAVHPNNLQYISKIQPYKKDVIFEISKKEFQLGERSMHGPWHWEKVERNAAALCRHTTADPLVCRLFAVLHDCKRADEGEDPDHGKRAAKFAQQLYKRGILPLNELQSEKLFIACEKHNDGEISDDPTIGACWDADRLDLCRVGIMPDKSKLSTVAAKQLMWRI